MKRTRKYKIIDGVKHFKCVCGCGNYAKVGNSFILGHHAKLRVGWHHSKEAKQKIREKHIGMCTSKETRKKQSESHKVNPISFWKGKNLSKEHKEKIRKTAKETYKNPEIRKKCGHAQIISEEHKEKVRQFMLTAWKNPLFREKLIGENANNWKGGVTFEPYGKEFNNVLRKQIWERDNYICQNPECKSPGKKLDTHHIDYNKQNNSETNLITLCCICHPKTNRNREYWTLFYQNIIKQKYERNKKYKIS